MVRKEGKQGQTNRERRESESESESEREREGERCNEEVCLCVHVLAHSQHQAMRQIRRD